VPGCRRCISSQTGGGSRRLRFLEVDEQLAELSHTEVTEDVATASPRESSGDVGVEEFGGRRYEANRTTRTKYAGQLSLSRTPG
jgi:hypothetical protein